MSNPSSGFNFNRLTYPFRHKVARLQEGYNTPVPDAQERRNTTTSDARRAPLPRQLSPAHAQKTIRLDICQVLSSLQHDKVVFELCDVGFTCVTSSENRLIESSVVITGTDSEQIMTTCGEYITWSWPSICDGVMHILNAIRLGTKSKAVKFLSDIGNISFIRKGNSCVSISVEGPVSVLADVAELLGWMTSAFQTTTGSVSSSLISFGQVPTINDSTPLFRFSVSGTESLGLSDSCWLPLIKQSVIASGFEIPARTGQKGLELSFDALIDLCGIECPADRHGKIIFLGLATILVPTIIFDDCSVQWHVIIAETPSRLQTALDELDSSISIFPAQYIQNFRSDTLNNNYISSTSCASLKEENVTGWPSFVSRLRQARHFLGWCKEIDILLGTTAGQYDSISWTTATESKTAKTALTDTFTLSAMGGGIFGVSFSRSYMITLNREQRFPFANRDAKYEEALSNHKEEQIILYDPEERRGWLVPFLSALLHIVILRLKWHGYAGALPYARPTWDGGFEALNILLRYRSLPLHTDQYNHLYRLEDMAKLLMFALQNTYPTKASSTIAGEHVRGHELMDLVTGEPPFRVKKRKVKWSHGGWPHLTRDVQIVLFCKGLGEVLRPSQNETDLCPSWQLLPTGAEYLGATIKGLKHLAARAGFSQSCEYLMEGYRWYCPHHSFIYQCERRTRGADNCSCDPLQRVEKMSGFTARVLLPRFIKSTDPGVATPSRIIPDEGAVVIGDSCSHRKVRDLVTALRDIKIPASHDQGKGDLQHPCVEPSEDRSPVHLYHENREPELRLHESGSTLSTPQEVIGLSRLSSIQPLQRWMDVPCPRSREVYRQDRVARSTPTAEGRFQVDAILRIPPRQEPWSPMTYERTLSQSQRHPRV